MTQFHARWVPTLRRFARIVRYGALVLSSVGLGASAMAQNADTEVEEIVVLGSQIRGASTTDALPVSVIGQEEISASGAISADELFRYLPGVGAVGFGGNNQRSTSYGINGARGDVASVNLRSLGEGNTLVLMNGRRLVDHPSTQTDAQTAPAVAVNMNTIPVMGLQRVEVLRDGASAIYGTDAVAGVVNTVLRKDFNGLDLSARFGGADGYNETTYNLIGGVTFNNDRTNITASLTLHDRDPLAAADRDWARNNDARDQVIGTSFEGDAQFNNRSTSTPWALFRVPNAVSGPGPITQNGVPITTGSGSFQLLPDSYGGCTTTIAAAPSDTCIAALTSIPQDLRFNVNSGRTLMPGVQRRTFFSTANHTFDNELEIYSEVGIYSADSFYSRADGGGGPLGTQPIDIPASNYWNPFGPVTFSDGTPNPNRLPGLDPNQIPVEGVALPYVGAEGASYRMLERGGPFVNVSDKSYRVLQGLRGTWKEWDFDMAYVYSEAETLDRTDNRIDLNRYMEQLALETPDAYNPWTGGGTYLENHFDSTSNPASVTDPYYASVDRYGKTRLSLADFKVSRGALVDLPAGGLGVAAGVEFRRHTYEDDRDPRLDGTSRLNNFVRNEQFPSSVMGSSDTPDMYGSRKVFSVFGEVAIPLVSPDMSVPLMQSVDLQLAGRYEDYNDIGSVSKPRVALSWVMVDSLKLRGSYSEGFKAPNLAAIGEPVISRSLGVSDVYYCQAQVNRGLVPNLGACLTTGVGNEYDVSVERLTSGSKLLKPEESTAYSVGFVFQPSFVENLLLTVDYWDIEQTGIIGIFNSQDQMSLDWALRMNGMAPNPDLVRAAPTPDNIAYFAGSGLDPVGQALQTNVPYFNMDDRQTTGLDISIAYDLDTTRFGTFAMGLSAAKLIKAFQSSPGPAAFINAQNEPAVIVATGGDLIEKDQRPEWKGSGYLRWSHQNFGGGLFVNYVGGFNDTSVVNDVTSEPWRVDSWTTVNLNADYRFSMGAFRDSMVRIGVNNLFDEDPPLADENFNYQADMHSPFGQYAYINLTLGLSR